MTGVLGLKYKHNRSPYHTNDTNRPVEWFSSNTVALTYRVRLANRRPEFESRLGRIFSCSHTVKLVLVRCSLNIAVMNGSLLSLHGCTRKGQKAGRYCTSQTGGCVQPVTYALTDKSSLPLAMHGQRAEC